jgi:hypothetical protein
MSKISGQGRYSAKLQRNEARRGTTLARLLSMGKKKFLLTILWGEPNLFGDFGWPRRPSDEGTVCTDEGTACTFASK